MLIRSMDEHMCALCLDTRTSCSDDQTHAQVAHDTSVGPYATVTAARKTHHCGSAVLHMPGTVEGSSVRQSRRWVSS